MDSHINDVYLFSLLGLRSDCLCGRALCHRISILEAAPGPLAGKAALSPVRPPVLGWLLCKAGPSSQVGILLALGHYITHQELQNGTFCLYLLCLCTGILSVKGDCPSPAIHISQG